MVPPGTTQSVENASESAMTLPATGDEISIGPTADLLAVATPDYGENSEDVRIAGALAAVFGTFAIVIFGGRLE